MSATQREHSVPCKSCGHKTYAKDRVCAFCRPDSHDHANAEALAERYER